MRVKRLGFENELGVWEKDIPLRHHTRKVVNRYMVGLQYLSFGANSLMDFPRRSSRILDINNSYLFKPQNCVHHEVKLLRTKPSGKICFYGSVLISCKITSVILCVLHVKVFIFKCYFFSGSSNSHKFGFMATNLCPFYFLFFAFLSTSITSLY